MAQASCKILKKLNLPIAFLKNIVYNTACTKHGGVAQLGARLNGIQKVEGSIPFISTKNR